MFTTLALNTMLLAFPAPRDRDPPDRGPGFLGVTFEAADAEGVVITEVRPDGPADKAGLRVNDVIRKFGGERVSFDTFAKKIIRVRPGSIVPLDVMRGTEGVVVRVKIGVRPEDFPFPLPDPDEKAPQLPSDPLPPPLPELPPIPK
jgi:predicted metalloprotease with PDZ domain